jgi:hypothetical protein
MWWAPRGLGQGMAACRPVRPSEVLSAVTERGEGEADRPTAATALNAGEKPRGGVGSIDDNFFKINDKLLFIMKLTHTAQQA